MITLRFKPLKSGKYSIYLDIYSSDERGNQKRQYEFLKLYVCKDYSKIRNVHSDDKNTVDLAEEILKKRELELVAEIKGLKVPQKATHYSVIGYLEKYYYKTNDFHIKSLLFHLKNYTEQQDLLFSQITPEWIEQFREYLALRMAHNTAKDYLKMLRARINDAFREDIINQNPFDKFEMPKELEVKRTTLDYNEVMKLVNTPFPSHPHVRTAFLFSCFSGLRISDVQALKWNDLIQEEIINQKKRKTGYCMNIRPIKTQSTSGKILKVPLSESAVMLLEEMKTNKGKSDFVFDKFPTPRNARNLLKLWAAKAGIKKNLHFHVARHSFATISLTFGMDIYTVSKLLGHSDLRNTEIYAKIVDEKKRMEIQKLPVLK